MTSTTKRRAGAPAGSTRRRPLRALAVVGAVVAALAVWVVAVPIAGVDLAAQLGGEGPPDEIGARGVTVTALAVGLAAWALLELLERVTRRPRRVWMAVALLVFALSLVGPLAGGVSAGATITLVCLHAAVAAALIGLMAPTASP